MSRAPHAVSTPTGWVRDYTISCGRTQDTAVMYVALRVLIESSRVVANTISVPRPKYTTAPPHQYRHGNACRCTLVTPDNLSICIAVAPRRTLSYCSLQPGVSIADSIGLRSASAYRDNHRDCRPRRQHLRLYAAHDKGSCSGAAMRSVQGVGIL